MKLLVGVLVVLICLQSSFSLPACKIDVVLCIDNSASISDHEPFKNAHWKNVLDYAQNLVSQLNVGPTTTHVGLTDFETKATLDFDLNKYQTEQEVKTAIASLRYKAGYTNMSGGLNYARQILTSVSKGARANVPKLVILITDGRPYPEDPVNARKEIDELKSANIRVVAVGVGGSIDVKTLKEFASTPTDYVFASDFSSLAKVAGSTINKDTCTAPPPVATNVTAGFDCGFILKKNPEAPSGLYWISVAVPGGSSSSMQVYCDMATAGGGWTVFQRRQDGSVDFYRNWTSYAAGFGDLTGEFWLGNDKIAALTNAASYRLRIDMADWTGETRFAQYDDFRITPAADKYKMSFKAGSYAGNAGDALTGQAIQFSTFDQDNDYWWLGNCATSYLGAWWYNRCHYSNLNGQYNNTVYGQGVIWHYFKGYYYSLKLVEMKLRANNV